MQCVLILLHLILKDNSGLLQPGPIVHDNFALSEVIADSDNDITKSNGAKTHIWSDDQKGCEQAHSLARLTKLPYEEVKPKASAREKSIIIPL